MGPHPKMSRRASDWVVGGGGVIAGCRLVDRVVSLETALKDTKQTLDENTAMTKQIKENTDSLVTLLNVMAQTGKFFRWTGWVAQNVVLPISLVVGGLFWWWKTGEPPKK